MPKKQVTTPEPVAPHPKLVELRDGLKTILASDPKDKESLKKGALVFMAAAISLVAEFGEQMEGLEVPDGFLDSILAKDRILLLIGALSAYKDKHGIED